LPRHPATLQGFLHWLALDNGKLKRDPEPARDEVRVMTVHGAKGLEAPLVIIADAATGPKARAAPVIFDFDHQLAFWRGRKESQPRPVAELVEGFEMHQHEERSRLLYVALTRAKDRLLIAGWQTRQEAAAARQDWHGLIASALAGIDGVVAHETPDWSDAEPVRCLQRGSVVPRATTPGHRPSAPTPLPAWLSRLPADPPLRRLTSPSRMGDEDPPAWSPREVGARALTFGVQLHRLLHQLAEIPPPAREAALRRAFDALSGDMASSEIAELVRQVRAVLELPALAPVFGPDSRGEQPIIGRVGNAVISGQIDRLAVVDGTVIMVEFKSGGRSAGGVDGVPRPYLRQLGAYASLLARIYPAHEIRAALVWTSIPEVCMIPPAVLHAYRLD